MHRRLGGVVVGLRLRLVDDEPGHRADVDDRAASRRQHRPAEGAAAPEDAVEIDVDDRRASRSSRDVLGRGVRARDAGVADEHVDRGPSPPSRAAAAASTSRRLRDVHRDDVDGVALGLHRRLRRLRRPSRCGRRCTTCAPASDSASTQARPMPWPPPVTTATRPVETEPIEIHRVASSRLSDRHWSASVADIADRHAARPGRGRNITTPATSLAVQQTVPTPRPRSASRRAAESANSASRRHIGRDRAHANAVT